MTIQQHASFGSSAAELNATSKLVKAWESKNAKNAAKAGGISLMALSLAACGGSSTTTTTTTETAAEAAAAAAAAAAAVAAVCCLLMLPLCAQPGFGGTRAPQSMSISCPFALTVGCCKLFEGCLKPRNIQGCKESATCCETVGPFSDNR